jgi:hypothetical protein
VWNERASFRDALLRVFQASGLNRSFCAQYEAIGASAAHPLLEALPLAGGRVRDHPAEQGAKPEPGAMDWR